MVVEGSNIGVYVRSSNPDFPLNGTYAAVASIEGGNSDLSTSLAKHCVLELPDKTGKLPKGSLSDDDVKNDEYRLYYQVKFWNVLENSRKFKN